MNLARLAIAAVLAVAITGVLVWAMARLIYQDLEPPSGEEQLAIGDITMPNTEVDERFETRKPDKPEEPEEVPEDIELEVETPDVEVGDLNLGAPRVNTNLQVAGIGGFSGDGEYLPIVKVQPVYPRRALQRGIEGYVIVEFTVTKAGAVRDPFVVEADPPGIFDNAAMKAALKFKYKPRVIDGEPIEVPGVQNKISFNIAK
jgi:protein TonB